MLILPLAALATLILSERTGSHSLRDAMVRGSVMWGFALVLLTEALSAFSMLSRGWLAAGWAVVLIAALVRLRRVNVSAPQVRTCWRIWPVDAGALSRVQLIAIVAVVVVTLALAVVAAPATEDSMVYHLPRVMHWIQDRSVALYPTHIARQLWPSPGGEFVVLHGQLLTGSDRLVTVEQWLAFLGDIALASLIAKELGAQWKGQVFAAFFFAVLPPAVAQASGAQVELVAAFWFGCAVVLGLQMIRDSADRPIWWPAFLFGAAIGLAILTKTTAFIFLAPFMLWYLIASIRRGSRHAIGTWAMAGLVALVVNAPHAARNLETYGSPLGRRGGNGQVNSEFFPAGFISNVVRNTSLHFGTRSERVNLALYDAVVGLHNVLGVSPDDPRTTFPRLQYKPVRLEYAEQTAGSPIHVVLIAAALLILTRKDARKYSDGRLLLIAVVAGFLLFSFYLRWQPWHPRLWVPLFAVAAGPVGVAFGSIASRPIRAAIVGAMMLGVVPALLLNPPRPLVFRQSIYSIPREQQYFAENKRWYAPYRDAANFLAGKGCYDIGLWVRGDGEEYQLWALLQERAAKADRRVRIRHIFVLNESKALAGRITRDNFRPCALIYIYPQIPLSDLPVPGGVNLVWQGDSFRIYSTIL